MTGKTETYVHSAEQMKAQRWNALADDRCALGGVSVFTQVFIGMALYLYTHVSTPGYLSILLTIPFALLLLYLAFGTAKNAGPEAGVIAFAAGNRLKKPVLFIFLLLHLLNAQLVFLSLCAMLMEAMPEHSLWKLALLTALALSWAGSGRKEDTLARLTRFLKWVIFVLFLYAVLTAFPHGSAAHFFPLLGYGWKTIGNGALWMCGAVSGCVWPLLRPQNGQALSPILERKSRIVLPTLFAILAGCAVMLVSVWLMPVYAMARSETLGWRLLLIINMTPSIPAWSMETVGVLHLFFLTLSNSTNEASGLLAGMAGKESASRWITLLLLLILIPCAVLQFDAVLDTLSAIASFRGPVALFLMLFLYLGSLLHRKRTEKGKEAAT